MEGGDGVIGIPESGQTVRFQRNWNEKTAALVEGPFDCVIATGVNWMEPDKDFELLRDKVVEGGRILITGDFDEGMEVVGEARAAGFKINFVSEVKERFGSKVWLDLEK